MDLFYDQEFSTPSPPVAHLPVKQVQACQVSERTQNQHPRRKRSQKDLRHPPFAPDDLKIGFTAHLVVACPDHLQKHE